MSIQPVQLLSWHQAREHGAALCLCVPIMPVIHFTDKLYILEREKGKATKKLRKWAKRLAMVGIPSGLKSERKMRVTLKGASEKNNALRRLKSRFEGSIN
ncbi:hypothetical protein AVEN_173833-1 [Araneus ventricosus]|uniref:Uncharacterized protein n=1 Tax=Araneus ventricosus TaxID=182803 RepID=A0A4Y2PAQ7_ARAVE|nr:hypothetical protein AVEN_173833-1 [Araneus ventricosus]